MINYFHKYIPHLAEIAAPLNTLRKKGVQFEWNEQRQTAFEKLKESIISPPVLQLADFTKPFLVQTDSSSVAPVSYTHLDVYKRQGLHCDDLNCDNKKKKLIK